jgi:hypothetical protein
MLLNVLERLLLPETFPHQQALGKIALSASGDAEKNCLPGTSALYPARLRYFNCCACWRCRNSVSVPLTSNRRGAGSGYAAHAANILFIILQFC